MWATIYHNLLSDLRLPYIKLQLYLYHLHNQYSTMTYRPLQDAKSNKTAKLNVSIKQ